MRFFLTQLQAFNAVYKLLDDYHETTGTKDIFWLIGDMLFLPDNNTVDSAIWEDWIDAIENKKLLSKQEAFNGMIKFLEIYRSLGELGDVTVLIDKLNMAKNANDVSVPLIKKWNLFLQEVLSQPEGTREYLDFGDPMQNIPPMVGFNTVYKLLDYYSKDKKSADIARMANNMLFLSPDADSTVDPSAKNTWMELLGDKLISTREEVFEKTIRFLEIYGERLSSSEARLIANELRKAKNSEDMSVPIVDSWNYCLIEALNEPAGSRKYVEQVKY